MKYAGAPPVASSTCAIASPRGCPLGSRPSVSTVNEIADGIPAATAARVTPTASCA
jgi:hypothetical protein